MPFDWSGYIANQIKNRRELSEVLGFVYDENMVADLEAEKARYDKSVRGLSDEKISAFNLVLLPRSSPLRRRQGHRGPGRLRDKGKIADHQRGHPHRCAEGQLVPGKEEGHPGPLPEGDIPTVQRHPEQGGPLFDTDIYGMEMLRKVGRRCMGNRLKLTVFSAACCQPHTAAYDKRYIELIRQVMEGERYRG
jgi:arsenite-transporting ATPase